MHQRLEEFLLNEGLTKAQFADSINISRSNISHIFAGRNKPGYEFIVNVMAAYPRLNIEWLLCGNGTMYKDGIFRPEVSSSDSSSSAAMSDSDSSDYYQDDLFAQAAPPAPQTPDLATKTPETWSSVPQTPDLATKTPETWPSAAPQTPDSATKTPETWPNAAQTPTLATKTAPGRTQGGIKRIVVYFTDGTYQDFVTQQD